MAGHRPVMQWSMGFSLSAGGGVGEKNENRGLDEIHRA